MFLYVGIMSLLKSFVHNVYPQLSKASRNNDIALGETKRKSYLGCNYAITFGLQAPYQHFMKTKKYVSTHFTPYVRAKLTNIIPC